jgi:hypothetical protein
MGVRHLTAVLGWTAVVLLGACGSDASQITTTTPETLAIDLVSPQVGVMAGGTVVTITGEGFDEGVEVTLGDAAATDVRVDSPTQLTAITPPAPAGPVDVRVTNSDGTTDSAAEGFSYLAEPAVPEIIDVTTEDGDIIVTIARPHVSEAIENYAVLIDDDTWQPLDPPQAAPALVLREQAPPQGTRIELRLRAINGAGQTSSPASVTVGVP